jgi:hypothetical protein
MRIFNTMTLSLLVWMMAFGPAFAVTEQRKVTRQDIEWSNNVDNTVASAGGHVGNPLDTAYSFSAPYVDVRAYGAAGDGTTDDTAAIQAAITAAAAVGVTTFGTIVFFPAGVYKVSSTLTVPAGKYVSFLGVGRTSTLSWFGADNGVMLDLGSNNAEAQVSVEKLRFFDETESYPRAIKLGADGVAVGLVNVSIKKCMFQNVASAVDTWAETDQLTFEDNFVLYYTDVAIYAHGANANSNYRIVGNHFENGLDDTWAVKHGGGANIMIDGNTIQSGFAGMAAISLTNVGNFSVTRTYYEAGGGIGATDGPFLELINSSSGVVEGNVTSGNTGPSIYTIDDDSYNIRFGPNSHGCSGGCPTTFIVAAANATDIFIYGKQSAGVDTFAAYSGPVSFYGAGAYLYASKPINQYNGALNIDSGVTSSLFTISASTAYLVYVKQATDGHWTAGFVQRQAGGASVSVIDNTSPNLTISASGNDLRATNGEGAVRTIEYSAFRLF